jgi:hypothetical protein
VADLSGSHRKSKGRASTLFGYQIDFLLKKSGTVSHVFQLPKVSYLTFPSSDAVLYGTGTYVVLSPMGHTLTLQKSGLEKTRVFKKKTSPVGFLGFIGFFWAFCFFLFFCFLYICPEERVF